MLTSVLMVISGLIVLACGGDILLRAAVSLATRSKIPPAIVGLTVVAAGTSIPELAVSIIASFSGSADIAVGNVIGSNISNSTFILGIAALVAPLAVTGNVIRLEYPIMVLVSLQALAVFDDGTLNHFDGVLFLCTYLGFTLYLIGLVRDRAKIDELAQLKAEVSSLASSKNEEPHSLARISLGLVAGIALLTGGAQLTVSGASELGRLLGLSERVIGLTIVAIGTSLPEVVTSIIAGLRGRSDVAIGNIIGSNLFNILVILGLSALITPLTISPQLRTYDTYWMLGSAIFLFPLMRSAMRVNRVEGAALVALYLFYIGTLLF